MAQLLKPLGLALLVALSGPALAQDSGTATDAETPAADAAPADAAPPQPDAAPGFCATCGTTMFFRSALAPGETHVALACADGPIDRAPALHVFTEAQVPWIELGDALPRADRDHPALVRYQAVDRAPT